MKIVDRYVILEWFKVFVASMCVILGILILNNMYSDLADLLDYGAGWGDILYYYWLILPSFIPLVLPVSLLISIVFLLGNLHKNNEITSLRASGMNDFKITRSLWVAGLILSVMLFFLNAQVVPSSVEKARTLLSGMQFAKERSVSNRVDVGKIYKLCFNNRADARIWYIAQFSQSSKKAFGIEINLLRKDGSQESKIVAKEGVFDDADNSWVFINGEQMFFDKDDVSISSESFEKKYYRDFNEDPEIMRLSMAKPKDLSLFELRELITSAGGEDAEAIRPYKVALASIWANSFACLIVVAIAIPFSISGVRTNPVVGVSKTAGLFFLYYFLDSVFTILGGNGLLPVNLAVWMPNVAMMGFAIFLFRKTI